MQMQTILLRRQISFMVTSIDTNIESLEPIGVQARSEDGYSNNSISAAKLLKGVEMSYDKGKKLLEESKKRSADLREQRVGGADGLRFFRTANGEAYGFTVGGKIYPELKTDDEIADRVIKDLLEGVDPRMMGNMEDGVRFNAKQKMST